MTEDEFIALSKQRRHEIILANSGIPRPRWGVPLKWPGHTKGKQGFLALSAEEVYEKATNVAIVGLGRDQRMHVVCWLAEQFLNESHRFSRQVMGYKHHQEAIHPKTHEVLTQPFSVKMMNAEELVELLKRCEKSSRYDDEIKFEEEILVPDFFFLTEIGHEWANTFVSRVIQDFLIIRQEAALPTIVTITKPLSQIIDKTGENIYEPIREFITEKFDKVMLK